ncbi:sulfite exporter TauE/SafE family protein [Melissococcus plutonius]|uniref:Probable membrane transporter protein n=1 Tax=Melissococcus plutonius TaxID=33970 RepID=A0A2Z5Y0T1_9ENTE|nr:sulfite exporter TauE/SafE family protein [Melissococcus plutonius]BAL61529.1 integral membrane protein [Melissococcus plutonius DAT561]MCV2499262.1 sulfite exporter TauE/SafE family protein [Melissococcus plutonius]MCV2501166.1 sulfite exporter TauE/SafE family protein [Melissococcus plutonius]MCV2505476.1 sulfite exporter TauE/SafE family protein [Melissococcus plutonius]MCV2507836.1 sulfite exporter TauE/SafE family protein [Melissococcus plutonius]
MVLVLLIIFILLAIIFGYFLLKDILANKNNLGSGNWIISIIIGFITDFLDTLGIGSFAPTTMLLNFTKQLNQDRLLPGTLNVAHSIPVLLEAILLIQVVKVSPVTLFSLIIAAILGSWVGSYTVAKLPEKFVQFWMGWALIATAVLMACKQLGLLDMLGTGNTATSLVGVKLVIGIIGNFIFGGLMTIGVGLYAPCMAMVYMLGLNPLVAFPVMMGSCAGLMPVASINFIKAGTYSRKVSLGITIGGIVGIIIAVNFLKGLNIDILSWIIVVVIIYTGFTYIQKSRKLTA